MKANLELTEKEAKKIFRKQKMYNIKFPPIESRVYYISLIVMLIALIVLPVVFYNMGKNDGERYGYSRGYDAGEQAALKGQYKDLTLENAVAYHLKYNIPKIFWWIGIVVGLGWVFHGVGFHLVKR